MVTVKLQKKEKKDRFCSFSPSWGKWPIWGTAENILIFQIQSQKIWIFQIKLFQQKYLNCNEFIVISSWSTSTNSSSCHEQCIWAGKPLVLHVLLKVWMQFWWWSYFSVFSFYLFNSFHNRLVVWFWKCMCTCVLVLDPNWY